jgi:hypothetical protein
MFRTFTLRICACIATANFAGVAGGASYNEFVQGDLPSNGSSPVALLLEPGVNLLVAQSSSADVDLLRITVPAERTLDSIVVSFHQDPNQVFTAVQAGPVWTAGFSEIDPALLLGWVDFPFNPDHNHTGENILPAMGQGAGATGFTPPLASGDYTFLFQTQSTNIPFALEFIVSGGATGPPGDFDGDLSVTEEDLATWRLAFGSDDNADADGDGDSDGIDYLIWQGNFGAGPGGGVPVSTAAPEPGGAILAVAAALLCESRRRRWR